MKCEERLAEGLVCDECLSPDIRKLKDNETDEFDCYCNNCKYPQYTTTTWWVNQPFNKIDWLKLAK